MCLSKKNGLYCEILTAKPRHGHAVFPFGCTNLPFPSLAAAAHLSRTLLEISVVLVQLSDLLVR